MRLFENKICGILNKIGGIANKILGIANKILVLFDRSIRIPRAHARIHKVFYPCNRCHLATLSENQYVTCDNEVTRVTRNGDFFLNIHSTQLLCLPKYCMWVVKPWASRGEGAASKGRRCRLQGSEVPPPWGEGAASVGRRYGLRGAWGLSLRVLGIVPLPPKGCLASPIGDIGVPP